LACVPHDLPSGHDVLTFVGFRLPSSVDDGKRQAWMGLTVCMFPLLLVSTSEGHPFEKTLCLMAAGPLAISPSSSFANGE
jgi:hypothetical protein